MRDGGRRHRRAASPEQAGLVTGRGVEKLASSTSGAGRALAAQLQVEMVSPVARSVLGDRPAALVQDSVGESCGDVDRGLQPDESATGARAGVLQPVVTVTCRRVHLVVQLQRRTALSSLQQESDELIRRRLLVLDLLYAARSTRR